MGSKSNTGRIALGLGTMGLSEVVKVGYDVASAPKQAAKEVAQIGRRQDRGQQMLEAQLAEDEARAQKTKAVRVDRAAQRSAAAALQGRKSTLLTGNLGLVGEPTTERRTLLGG